MFSDLEVKKRNRTFSHLFKYSDAILVSSRDALKSLNYFSEKYFYKASVLSFNTLPPKGYFELNDSDRLNIFKRYSIPGPYFYLPNQFWKHKDHLTVFKAIEIVIKMGKNIFLVCSGNFNDFRNPDYFDSILKFININNLQKNIILLGMIKHEDVYSLIKFSKAVINPSFFEGWSTTVEECKSVGKQIILSDIDVHKEQAPHAIFFKKGNSMELAKIIFEFTDSTKKSNHNINEIKSNEFVDNYIKLVKSISQKNRE
jgi:glycosyltransferase involved in cell wall biosynthesis